MYSRGPCYYHPGGTAFCRVITTQHTPLCAGNHSIWRPPTTWTWREDSIPPKVPPLLQQLLRRLRPQQCGTSQFCKQCYHPPRNTTPLQVCGCSSFLQAVSPHSLLSHPSLPHPLQVCGSAIAPPGLSHPLHGPYNQPALYHPGYTRYHASHRIKHPVIDFLNSKWYHRGVSSCVIR